VSFKRVFYASAAGDVVAAHRAWLRGDPNPVQIQESVSSQIQDFCRELGAKAYVISPSGDPELLNDGQYLIERRPKPGLPCSGIAWHLRELRHGLGLLRTARRFGADLLILDSGSVPFYLLGLLPLGGARILAVLHNSLRPGGQPPRGWGRRLAQWLDLHLFWRRIPMATLGVSPACVRQLREIAGASLSGATHEFRLMFRRDYFDAIPPAPSHRADPFRVNYVGRATREKGATDVLRIARRAEDRLPGRIRWEVCGDGPELGRMRELRVELGLESIVDLRGWVPPAVLREVHARSHAGIVPTRGTFAEGMAATAAESILAGRPIVTSANVPALELLRPACVQAAQDDVESHADAVVRLATDAQLYETVREACTTLQGQFYDRAQGLAAVLRRAVVDGRTDPA
jgi:glycogen synthase